MKRLVMVLVVLVCGGVAKADFVKIDEIEIPSGGEYGGIEFEGDLWHLTCSGINGWKNFSSDFVWYYGWAYNSDIGSGGAMAFDASAETLFIVDDSDGTIVEVGLDGQTIQTINPGIWGFEAVAYDDTDDTLWYAYKGGRIEHRTRNGGFIASMMTDYDWRAIEFDNINDSLIMLDYDDNLMEYSTDGTFLGTLLGDEINGEGQDLKYFPSTGMLYAISLTDEIAVFMDASRVPEPSTIILLLTALLPLVYWYRKK